MQKSIHPHYNEKAIIICDSCKTEYTVGSTQDEIHVEVCANCHPHYTGESGILVDADSMIDKFKKKTASADISKVVTKRKKRTIRKSKSQEFVPEPRITLKKMMEEIKK